MRKKFLRKIKKKRDDQPKKDDHPKKAKIKLWKVLTEKELLKVVQAIDYKKYKLAFMLGFYQCMRVSEVAKLTKEDIDIPRKLIYIEQGKGYKDRNIPIAPQTIRKLKYLPCGSSMAKDRGVRAIQYAFNNATEKALGKRLNFHLLRHSGITFYLTKKKWNTLQVQRMAGHSKSSITEIYTHINPEDLVEKMWGEEDE